MVHENDADLYNRQSFTIVNTQSTITVTMQQSTNVSYTKINTLMTMHGDLIVSFTKLSIV